MMRTGAVAGTVRGTRRRWRGESPSSGPRVWLAALMLCCPSLAYAGNGVAPAVHPEFPEAPCLHVVDLSSVDELHLPYTIPEEDLELTEDEVADSRTHQFFAFDEQALLYPRWISEADVQAAASLELVDPDSLVDEDVLEHSPAHEGHWVKITSDEMRRPVSFAAAQDGVSWDLSVVAPGVWIVAVYAHKPPASSWSRQPSTFVFVEDEGSAVPPAAWLLGTQDVLLGPGDSTGVRACVSSSVVRARVEVAPWGYDTETAWHTQALVEAPPTGNAFDVEIQAPCEPGQHRLRLVVEDASGAEYVAVSHTSLGVLDQEVECTPPIIDEDEPGEGDDDERAGCRLADEDAPFDAWLVALVAFGLARRLDWQPRAFRR